MTGRPQPFFNSLERAADHESPERQGALRQERTASYSPHCFHAAMARSPGYTFVSKPTCLPVTDAATRVTAPATAEGTPTISAVAALNGARASRGASRAPDTAARRMQA